MPKQTYTISRDKDDPGPKLLIATGMGRTLRLEKGGSVEIQADPEDEAAGLFLRQMEVRYKVDPPAPQKETEAEPKKSRGRKGAPAKDEKAEE
jgi:hypothetical protein